MRTERRSDEMQMCGNFISYRYTAARENHTSKEDILTYMDA